MAKAFNARSFGLRLLFAIALVFITYNPSGLSFYHWASDILSTDTSNLTPPFSLLCVVLLIGWTIYLRATFRSLGGFGVILAFGFFAIIIWWLVDLGVLGLKSSSFMAWIFLFLLSAILAAGLSWSHIRRRLSGQTDMDDVDD